MCFVISYLDSDQANRKVHITTGAPHSMHQDYHKILEPVKVFMAESIVEGKHRIARGGVPTCWGYVAARNEIMRRLSE